jgi:cell division protein FtsA
MPRIVPITAIDLGTDKCVTLIGTISAEDGLLHVIGVAAVPSRGMKKSQIVDLEDAMNAMSESIDAAERMAGCDINRAFISVSGTQIASQNSKGVVAVASPNQDITAQDVERVLEAARAISLPSAREIVHVVPRDFSVDSQTGIKDPVGMTGIRLESEAHIVTVQSTLLRNVSKILNDLGVRYFFAVDARHYYRFYNADF